jgi:peptidoglycan/xylan/chitin deacetylase (PgdA/CDA1 family)
MIVAFICIFFCFLSRPDQKREARILAYHSVDANRSFYSVNLKDFHCQMEYLRRNYDVLSLDQLLDFVAGKESLHRRSVALTFDDGYYDNYSNVYPYLKKYNLPAAVFLSTGRVGQETNLDGIPLKMLAWRDILEMSQNNVTMGAHTVRHRDLTKVTIEEARDEIVKSKQEIESNTGRDVQYFAYPHGKWNEQTDALLRSIGFRGAFTTRLGVALRGDTSFLLNRISIDRSIPFFLFKALMRVNGRWSRAVEIARAISRPHLRGDSTRVLNRLQVDSSTHFLWSKAGSATHGSCLGFHS